MRVFLATILLTGCHAKLKKAAPHIDDISVQVINTGGPYVELGKVYASSESGLADLAAAAVNVTQEIRSINQTERIAAAVDVADVNAALAAGLGGTLGGGPPFAYNPGEGADATLQLEVLSYGLYVPSLGAAGEFTYTVRARLYEADGDKVYCKTMTCETGVGDPSAAAQVLGVVNNVKQLDEMSDEEISQAFADVAYYCGQQFVVKMRKHAD